ncbi:hypothetical protein [Mesorhizobium dulcispinae]|uniref:hypothetical protein n=1 Tax=Mesorhizobium dulcispinae TaxID=3072316 RepID=UPI002A24CC0C|nr:hypothetical protein [Mesorhizobium sp. VK23D]MDX8521871.1 hypothetical protein [Mesorhizobium sp. VK23D]
MRPWAACYGTTRAPSKATLLIAGRKVQIGDRAPYQSDPVKPSFVSEAAFSQVGDANDHASLGIEWQFFKIEAAVEGSHSIVERMGQDAEAADLGGESNRSSEREQQERASTASTLIVVTHSKLAKQYHWDRIGAIALRRLGQICPLDLAGAEGNVSGNETARGIADDAGA